MTSRWCSTPGCDRQAVWGSVCFLCAMETHDEYAYTQPD